MKIIKGFSGDYWLYCSVTASMSLIVPVLVLPYVKNPARIKYTHL